jgi:hypothetical protein
MPLSPAQAARQRLGGLTALNGDPDLIAEARNDLAFAVARQRLGELTAALTSAQRAELARDLVGDHDNA